MTPQMDAGVACLARKLCQAIGEPRYNLWFHDKTRFQLDQDTLIVGVPKLHLQEWLERSFGDEILKVAREVFGPEIRVRFAIDSMLFQQARQQESQAKEQPIVATAPCVPAPVLEAPPVRKGFRRMRRLEDFVVGPCNRVAHAAVVNLLEASDTSLLPLVLHGPIGTGKTHLLEALYLGLKRLDPGADVLFMTAEDFTNRFVQAMHQNKLPAFRKQFRQCDALLIDDVQFLARKKATREEFLHTLDTLLASGRIVVATCDMHPRLGEEFPKELVDRLCGGAVWGLTIPDPATRLGILRAKTPTGTSIDPEVLAYLAEHLRGNARELEGAIHSVTHLARVQDTPITREIARAALAEVIRHSIRVVTPTELEASLCQALGIEADQLRSKARSVQAGLPRLLFLHLARKHTAMTYGDLGKFLGGRHHTTVLAQEKKAKDLWAEDATVVFRDRPIAFRELVERIENVLAS